MRSVTASLPLNCRRHARRRRGVTLLLTLLLIALLALVLARQSLRVGTTRIAALAKAFAVESRWAAEGAAAQLLEETCDPSISWDDVLSPRRWHAGEILVDMDVTATEHKLSVQAAEPETIRALWRTRGGDLALARDPQRALIESGYTAIECLLEADAGGARAAYVATDGRAAVADVFTVWGDGRIDLNRAPREVLTATLDRFTDAQISGIIRVRTEEPIDSLARLAQELSLSVDQQETLGRVGVFHPRHLELLITVRRGQMEALYHAMIDAKAPGRVLELRAVQ